MSAEHQTKPIGLQLPVELLGYIFELVICPIPSSERANFAFWASKAGFTRDHATIMSVCGLWRTTALTFTPWIWTLLRFNPGERAAEKHYERDVVLAMLERSLECQFTVVISSVRDRSNSDKAREIKHAIALHIHRCQGIWIEDRVDEDLQRSQYLPWDLPSPALRQFGVRTTNTRRDTGLFADHISPLQLDELYIESDCEDQGGHMFVVPHNVDVKHVAITLSRCRYSNPLELSSHFQGLQRLTINIGNPSELFIHEKSTGPFVFHSLKVLKLPGFMSMGMVYGFSSPNIVHLRVSVEQLMTPPFSHFHFPQLATLAITSHPARYIASLALKTGFLSRHCTLRCLAFSVHGVKDFEYITKLLDALRGPRAVNDLQRTQPTLLPLLEALAIFFEGLTPQFITERLPTCAQMLEDIKSSRNGVSLLLRKARVPFFPLSARKKVEELEWEYGDDVVDFCLDDCEV